jgi:dihydroorotase
MKNSSHIIFKNCRVTDPLSDFNETRCDIEVIEGVIFRVSKDSLASENAEIIDLLNARVSPGIFDLKVNCGEPGLEEIETFESLTKAGLAGGVTGMLVMPANTPPTDNRGQIEYRRKLAQSYPIDYQLAGKISKDGQGKQLSELYDMHLAGAIAFTDDKSLDNNDMLLHLSMQYQQLSKGLLMFQADDVGLRLGGVMHEGEISVQLGMKGTSDIVEEIGLSRLLALAKYHSTPIHISGISSGRSLEQIVKARNEGLNITCSVYVHHLLLCDEDLRGFDSNFKVWPPLRSKADRDALIKAVKSGVIDVVCSDHRPETIEHKEVEFDYAAYGVSGTETLWNAALTAIPEDSQLAILVNALCHNPRRILGMPEYSINPGKTANFMVYNSEEESIIDKKNLKSLGKNNAFLGKTLKAKFKGTYTEGAWFAV